MLDTCDMMPFMSQPASGDLKSECYRNGILDTHDATRFEAVCKVG